MIICLSLNPSLDTAITVDKLCGRSVKAQEVSYKIASKAMNAADALLSAGDDVRSLVFMGQAGEFAALNRPHEPILHSKPIRQNFSFYEGGELIAHVRGPFRSNLVEMRSILEVAGECIGADDVLLIAGSLPDLDAVDREGLIDVVSQLPGRLVMDVSSLTLTDLSRIAPHTIKLNRSEFGDLIGHTDGEGPTHIDLKRVHELTGSAVIVTQGAGDILAVSRTSKLHTFSIATGFVSDAPSVVGSGDAFLAGYVSELRAHAEFVQAVRRGVTFGVARQQAVALEEIDFSPRAIRSFEHAPVLCQDR